MQFPSLPSAFLHENFCPLIPRIHPFFSTPIAFVQILITSPLDYAGLSKRVPIFCVIPLCPIYSTSLPCFRSSVVPYSVRDNTCYVVDITWLLDPLRTFIHCLRNLCSPTSFPQRTYALPAPNTNHTKRAFLLLPLPTKIVLFLPQLNVISFFIFFSDALSLLYL